MIDTPPLSSSSPSSSQHPPQHISSSSHTKRMLASNKSPEMTRTGKPKKLPLHKRGSSLPLTTPSPTLRKAGDLPPRPPPQLQPLATAEDLSFADFSAMEDALPTSLSGYLQEPSASRHKVSAVDVASVGNASDTMVQHNMATRELHEKAKLAFNLQEYSEALPLFEAILSAQMRRFSTVHPSVGAAMHNVGVCRQRLGQHTLAENLFQEAVRIREQCLGPDHLEVAASLSKLGAAQTAQGKFEDAYLHLRKAVKIAIHTLGHQHKTVAQMLCHLACLYFEAGELMSAEATFEDALDIYRAVWSTAADRDACMTQLTDTLCNVGSIQNRRKRFAAAGASFSEALDLQRGIVGPDDARIISTLDNLGYSYSKLKDYGGALQCYRKMFRAQVSAARNTFTTTCFETFRKQILMYEKLRRYQDAIDETTQTLQLERSLLPRDHAIIAQTEDMLDDLQLKLRREC